MSQIDKILSNLHKKYFYLIILYQKIINILILRSIKQASWTIQFSQQASEHKRNSVADRIVMKRDISTEDVSKMQKCKNAVNF